MTRTVSKTRGQTAARSTDSTARPLKDARAGALDSAPTMTVVDDGQASVIRLGMRAGTRRQYAQYLDFATSKNGDRFSFRTIEGYLKAVESLGRYLDRTDFTGGYEDVTAEILNAYLADHRTSHAQGGTNSTMRRLRPFFNWLAQTYEIDNPYATGRVSYYAASAPAPIALGTNVIDDLLSVCKSQLRADNEEVSFAAVRDLAIIHLLRSGVRREELVSIWVEDVDWGTGVIQVVALKGSRRNAAVLRHVNDRGDGLTADTRSGTEIRAGRRIPVPPETLLALQRWMRVRAHHPHVEGRVGGPHPVRGVTATSGPLFYGTRGRRSMTGSGVHRMIKRRGWEAGYDPKTINVHAFRHTRADELKRNPKLSDNDRMAVMGWSDRAMLDRYAANLDNERAIDNLRRAGLA